jgi:hypothetical protein
MPITPVHIWHIGESSGALSKQPADELRLQEARSDRSTTTSGVVGCYEGDNQAINTICRLMERRARLLGLDMPVKIEQDVTHWEGGERH